MALSHNIAVRVTRGGIAVVDSAYTQTADAAQEIDTTIPANSTNYPLAVGTVELAKTKSFVLWFSTDCTLKTNSTGSPAETWTMKAGDAFIWNANNPTANPFSADLTEIYITNSTTATQAKLYFLTSTT
jgi:hypothetical protein